MNSSDTREHDILEVALKMPHKARAAYLDQVCGGDPALRQRILEAIVQAEKAVATTTTPASLPDNALQLPVLESPTDEKPGDRIGHYKLLQILGEGGMGRVWVAEQTESLRRQVALKVVKLGMDTRQVIARFEAECQALALMDHPGIAKVFDAGATPTGRPFFVMELVKGLPITEYCDKNTLPPRDRLMLFAQVCKALNHAHEKGIIHRDVKPSNILVTLHDGLPVPKIIDFGIAKAIAGQRLTDKTLYTAIAEFMGTPAYMSPEQAEMSAANIDIRSDIYSLGVLLYELMTGTTPFDAQQLRQAGIDGIRRIIREEDPPRPSTKLTMLDANTQTTIARHRKTELPDLLRVIRADLDWVILKTLEKDRTRRYPTANALAEEICHVLNQQPVIARRPGAPYRIRKVVLRRKAALATSAAILAALILIAITVHTLFKRGEIIIQTDPSGASVWLSARQVGTTPYKASGITPGSYQYVLRYPAYEPQEVTITATRGTSQLVTYLKQSPSGLSTNQQSSPPQALVAALPRTFETRIEALQGTVELLPLGETDWVLVGPGQFLRAGDTLRTGTNSRVTLKFANSSVVSFGSLTSFQILPLAPNELPRVFHRDSPTNSIRIITRGAVVGVEG